MNEINDYTVYNQRMRRSLIDKAFFLDKIDADLVVDYGCGDGSLLKLISDIFPEMSLIGYDISEHMLTAARNQSLGDRDPPYFTSDWNAVKAVLADTTVARTAVVCNSLIHEVYSYQSAETVDRFWSEVFDSGFDFVVIRDMARRSTVDTQIGRFVDVDEPSNPKMVEYVRETCRYHLNIEDHLNEFEDVWGSIDRENNLTHFLMKYRYVENWDREVRENYLPLSTGDIVNRIPHERYDLVYADHQPLPFNVRQIRKDFGFTFEVPTHYKLILELKQHGSGTTL